jgi:cobalt/nickel transport system permease protein
MSDALLSPAVGGVLWLASATTLAHCSRHLQRTVDERRVPLMGVLGAFLFAAQMINFAIPGTGSSGHLGGGLLLAILLGPHAAVLVMASVLIVQALFFADGGLLALGCNIFNLGVIPAFVGYPVYRLLAGTNGGATRATAATAAAAVLSLLLGASAVVLETVASGVSALPLGTFVLFMLPIHLAIGLVEGAVTAAIVGFVRRTRPDVLVDTRANVRPLRGFAAAALFAALAIGGIGAWYASGDPDGLEWSLARVAGEAPATAPGSSMHEMLARLQSRVAILPDYGFASPIGVAEAAQTTASAEGVRLGTSVSGIAGSVLSLCLALLAGFALRRMPSRP